MREAEFRAWLGERRWKGEPLQKKAKDNRVRRSGRAERGLQGLGFAETTLEAVFAEGQWDTFLARLNELKAPGADPVAVKSVVPQAAEPSGQLTNMIAALKQYGYFLEGRDPNYGAVQGDARTTKMIPPSTSSPTSMVVPMASTGSSSARNGPCSTIADPN